MIFHPRSTGYIFSLHHLLNLAYPMPPVFVMLLVSIQEVGVL